MYYYNKNNKLHGLLALVAAFFSFTHFANAAELAAVRFGVTSPKETRLVFDFKGLPEYSLTADAAGKHLVVSFSNSTISKAFQRNGKGTGQVSAYALDLTLEDRPQITFSLGRDTKIKDVFVISPSKTNPYHRMVIDLTAAKSGELAASLPPQKFENLTQVIAAVAPVETAALPAQPTIIQQETPGPVIVTRPVIVVDAGHGGSDPGAAGAAGSQESALTLSAALALAEILRETGRYDVVLTRSENKRLAHEERSRIARDAKAGLFISLHADAHSDPKVRGGSVYTLSDEGTERSAREALANGNYNVYDLDVGQAGQQVGGILYNLAQRETANESDKFAEILISKLSGVTPLLNNTHRRANFKVLLAPDVPAVLLELAFISNKQDESNLRSPAWRKRSIGAAAAAIDAYFQQRAAAKHASNAIDPEMR
jgi:N-acetylmuramoyl-L-alanine amidase